MAVNNLTAVQEGWWSGCRVVILLALPVFVENLLAMLLGWSDLVLAGRILHEPQYIAAIGAASYLLWMLESCAAFISHGAHAVVARLVGARKIDDANRIVMQSLLLAVLLGVALCAGVWAGADRLAGMVNLRGQAKELAATYLRIIAVSCPEMVVMFVGTTCLRAAGHTLVGMRIVSAVNALNIVLSWTLIHGAGPVPALGWTGIALGTSLSFIVGGVLTVIRLFRGYSDVRLPRSLPMLDAQAARRIFRIGAPGAANTLGVCLCHIVFVSIIGELGTTAVAAHSVAIRCESLSWLTAEALSIAAATLVGQSLGAQRGDLARRFGWTCFALGAAILSLFGVLLFTMAHGLVALFVSADQPTVLQQTVPLLRLVAFSMPGLAANLIFTGAMRGAGDTRLPLLYNLLGLTVVRLPFAYLLAHTLSLGLYGAWIAMLVDLTVRGIAAMYWFSIGKWTQVEV